MNRINRYSAGLGLATIMLAPAPGFSAYFTIDGGFGDSDPFNILSSNVEATSTYSSSSNSSASDFDDLIGANDVQLTDTSSGGEVNSFLDGTSALGPADNGEFLDEYRLFFEYELSGTAQLVDGGPGSTFSDGTMDADGNDRIDSNFIPSTDPDCTNLSGCGIDAIVPNYTSGEIEMFHSTDGGTTKDKVLQLDLVSATPDGTNVVLFADVNYDWYAGGSFLVENMFNFVNPVSGLTNWYDLWEAGEMEEPIEIMTRTDFNIDPNLVPESNGDSTFSRTTNLNMTTEVSVPEPAMLALFGGGLMALGFFAANRRRRNDA